MIGDCIVPTHHYRDKDGYPKVKHKNKVWRLSRLIWTLLYGPIPKDQVVAHNCNNKGCVNPKHFYLTTAAINSTHAARDGLYKPYTKYSDDDLDLMYSLYYNNHYTQWEIAKVFNTNQSTISSCIRRYKRKVGDVR